MARFGWTNANNSSTNSTDYSMYRFCDERSILDQSLVRWIFIVLYVAVFCCCLFGNLLILLVLCMHRAMRSATSFFLANLALADLLVAVFCIVQNFIHLILVKNSHWPFGALMCRMYVFVLHFVSCVSAGILVLVSIEKYVAILHPLLARKWLTKRRRVALTAAVWLFSLLVNSPYYFGASYFKLTSLAACGRHFDIGLGLTMKVMVMISFVLWYLLPVALMALLYTRIGLVLWRSADNRTLHASIGYRRPADNKKNKSAPAADHSRVRQLLQQQQQQPQADAAPGRQESANLAHRMAEARRRVIRLLVAVVLSFSLLTLPNHGRLFWLNYARVRGGADCPARWTALLQPLAYLMLFVNSGINPFLYAFLSQRFRAALKQLLHCRRARPFATPRLTTTARPTPRPPQTPAQQPLVARRFARLLQNGTPNTRRASLSTFGVAV